MKLAEAGDGGRAQRGLPAADEGAVDGDGEEHVGLAEVGVVEEVVDAGFEGVDVEDPAAIRDVDAELVLFVALRGQGSEGVFAGDVGGVLEHGAGDGFNGRGLEEVAVEAAQDPVEAGDFDSGADARVDGGFVEGGAVDAEALAAEEGDVAAEAEGIGEVVLVERGGGEGGGVGLRGRAGVVDDDAVEVVLMLVKGVERRWRRRWGRRRCGRRTGRRCSWRTDPRW